MANIRNFGLDGVAANVQLGKAGPRLVVDTTGGTVAVEALDSAGSVLVNLRAAPATLSSDVVVKAQLDVVSSAVASVGNKDGFDILLGDPAKGDGSFTNPAGAVLISSTTKVSSAIDDINEVLGLLVPAQPPQLTATSLSVSSVGNTPLLASGSVPTNGNTPAVSAGTAATRITAANVTSNTFTGVGPGTSGVLSLLLNGSASGSHTLVGGTVGADNGTFGGLVIAGEAWYPPATPGFWMSINASVNQAVSLGWNRIHLSHTGDTTNGGVTNEVYFVRDTMTASPVVAGLTVTQSAAGSQAYSSSVPHYGTGGALTVNLNYTNLSGEFYYGGTDPIAISSSNSIFATQNYNYPALGISTPIARLTTTATTITPITVNVNGAVFASGVLTATAKNVNGSGAAADTHTILVFNNAAQGVNENSVAVNTLGTGSGNAVRVGGFANTDTPSSLANSAWVSSAALATYEAAVVAGVLSNNVTNYSTGYFPVGPNLTGQAASQYITFAITRSTVSQFKIAVAGSYAGCWIGLPGVSDNSGQSPNALGGAWWNGKAAYSGSGVPGRTGDAAAGCASGTVMSGGSGTFTMTFGTQSSSNSTGNVILVRFKLTSGQSITALSFSN